MSRAPRTARILAAFAVVGLALGVASVAAATPTGYNTTGIDVRTFDLATGTGAVLGASGIGDNENFADLALSPSGILFGVTAGDGPPSRLWTISTTTGAATPVGDLGTDAANAGLTFTADGRLWMVQGADLFGVDPATGAATLLGSDSASFGFTGLAGSCGTVLYAVRFADPGGELVRIDVSGATPVFTTVGPLGLSVPPNDYNSLKIAFDAAGVLWGKNTNTEGTFTINLTTGAATLVSGTTDDGPGLTIAAPVCAPAPATPIASDQVVRFTG